MTATREEETREAQVRQWQPASNIPDVPQQEGWVFRWVRAALLGVSDPANMSARMREGWEPVNATEFKSLAATMRMMPNHQGQFEIGGLLLCKMPKEMAQQRDQYYADMSRRQITSVNNQLFREQDARMPLFNESKTTTSRGRFGQGK